MDQVREAGVDRIAAVCLALQYSELSVGLYIRRTEEALRDWGFSAGEIKALSEAGAIGWREAHAGAAD